MPLAQQFPASYRTNKVIERHKDLQSQLRHRQTNKPKTERKVDNMEGYNEEYSISLSNHLSRLFFYPLHRSAPHMKRTSHIFATVYWTFSLQFLAQSQNGFPRLRCP